MSTESTSPSTRIHILVLVHGMWGHPGHLAEMNRIFGEVRAQADSEPGPSGERLHILAPETNKESGTYDGIDWCGERVADEVLEEVKRLEDEGENVTRFSVIGYSLGGLISRYLVGTLYQRNFFDRVATVNFMTVATPHIGLIRYRTFRSSLFAFFGPRILSRTGEQFYSVDTWSSTGRPLLDVMSDPGRIFMRALSLFSHIRFYANAVNDATVPYPTAAIEAIDPFVDHEINGIRIELDEKYSPLIKSWTPALDSTEPVDEIEKTWRDRLGRLKVPLPPFLQFSFPYNVLLYVSLPVLMPTLITLVLVRLSMEARSSRSRIKLLEQNESYSQRLANVFGHLEKQVEDVVVDMFDDPGAAPSSGTATPAQPVEPEASVDPTVSETSKPKTKDKCKKCKKGPKSTEPQLTDLQKKMVQNLNALPQLKKELAFIHPVFNSHAVIVARDVKRFKHHEQGHGVIKHMVDNFVM